MKIEYNVLLDCPRCKAKNSVVVGAEKTMCFLCSWKRKKR
jgi:phage FluMu protein Com